MLIPNKNAVAFFLGVAGASMVVVGAQGAIAMLPKTLAEMQRIHECFTLYQEILATPDLIATLDTIHLSSYNLNAAKKVSEMSGFDLIQSIVLVKFCIYKHMNSLADIPLELVGSIIYNFKFRQIINNSVVVVKKTIKYICYCFFLVSLLNNLLNSNIIFFDPFYSLMDLYSLVAVVGKLPPSSGGGPGKGSGGGGPGKGNLEFPFNYPDGEEFIRYLAEIFYMTMREFVNGFGQVIWGMIATQFYALGNRIVRRYAQQAGIALVGMGFLGTSIWMVHSGHQNFLQLLGHHLNNDSVAFLFAMIHNEGLTPSEVNFALILNSHYGLDLERAHLVTQYLVSLNTHLIHANPAQFPLQNLFNSAMSGPNLNLLFTPLFPNIALANFPALVGGATIFARTGRIASLYAIPLLLLPYDVTTGILTGVASGVQNIAIGTSAFFTIGHSAAELVNTNSQPLVDALYNVTLPQPISHEVLSHTTVQNHLLIAGDSTINAHSSSDLSHLEANVKIRRLARRFTI